MSNETEKAGGLVAPSQKVESLARALCTANGFAPDLMVTPDRYPQFGPKGHILATPADKCFPAWQIFISDARAVLALAWEHPG